MRALIAVAIFVILSVAALSFTLPHFTVGMKADNAYTLDNFASPTSILNVPFTLKAYAAFGVPVKDLALNFTASVFTPDYFASLGAELDALAVYKYVHEGFMFKASFGTVVEKYPFSAPFEFNFPLSLEIAYTF